MTSAGRGLLALVAALALSWPAASWASCPNSRVGEPREGGIGGTGHAPQAGGVGGTGRSSPDGGIGGTGQRPDDGGMGGTGQRPDDGGVGGTGRGPDAVDDAALAAGGIGGTGVLGELVEDAGGARLCLAGYELVTSATTTLLGASGDTQALSADGEALRGGLTVWAVGSADAATLHAEHIEIFEGDVVALDTRLATRGVRHLVLETEAVDTATRGQLRAAGLSLRASPALVEQSRGSGRLRIRAERDDGGYRAVRVERLPAPVRPEREAPMPAPTPVDPAPAPTPVDPTSPTLEPAPRPSPPSPSSRPDAIDRDLPKPPQRPQSDVVPPTRVVPERPTALERPPLPERPAATERPERPIRPDLPPRPPRPHKPDLPPRPTIDRVSPVDG